MNIKQLTGQITKAADDSGFDGTFVLSTESVDRDGDIIELDGWDLRNFKRNPIALYQHDHRSPVGKWENIRIESNRLVADLKLASTNLAEMTRQLINDGVLKAVSVGFRIKDYEYRDEEKPWDGLLIKAAELLEASLVSVPANQDALMLSKSLGLSDPERATIFADFAPPAGKSADPALLERARSLTGKSANPKTEKPDPRKEGKHMTLSERIKGKRAELVKLREELSTATEKYAEDASDENRETVEAFAGRIEETETQLKTLEKAESAIAAAIDPAGSDPDPQQAPGIIRSRKNLDAGELIFRQASVALMSHISKRSFEDVRRDRYRNDKELEAVMKAAVSPADTTTAAWAADLLETQVQGFVDLLANNSVYGVLRNRGVALNFAGAGALKIPSRTAASSLAGDFVGEGEPIPVKKGSFSAQTLNRHKLAVITTMTEEIMDATNSQMEAIVRQAIIDDTAKVLDTRLLDSNAASATRPAGLLNGVTPTASSGASSDNVITDLKALIAAFTTSDAARDVVMAINLLRKIGLATKTNAVGAMVFKEDVARGSIFDMSIAQSGNVGNSVVHAIGASDFATAYGAPMFKVSDVATLHEEDTTPAQIGTSGSPNVVAAPVRSLFQTNSIGIKMTLPVTWTMLRAGQVTSLSGVGW